MSAKSLTAKPNKKKYREIHLEITVFFCQQTNIPFILHYYL